MEPEEWSRASAAAMRDAAERLNSEPREARKDDPLSPEDDELALSLAVAIVAAGNPRQWKTPREQARAYIRELRRQPLAAMHLPDPAVPRSDEPRDRLSDLIFEHCPVQTSSQADALADAILAASPTTSPAGDGLRQRIEALPFLDVNTDEEGGGGRMVALDAVLAALASPAPTPEIDNGLLEAGLFAVRDDRADVSEALRRIAPECSGFLHRAYAQTPNRGLRASPLSPQTAPETKP